MNELREQVRSHYAAAATSGSGCCSSKEQTGVLSLGSGDPLPAADLRAGERVLDLGSGAGPDVIRAARAGRHGRDRLGSRHDRRDARARTAERCRSRCDQRPLPERAHRGGSAPRGERRRGDLELRDQSLDGQAGRLPRTRSRRRSRRPRRDQRHRRRRPADPRRASRARLLLRLHRGRALEDRIRGRARRRRLRGRLRRVHVRCGRRACTARSSRRRSRPRSLAPNDLVREGAERSADRRRDEMDPE